MLRYIKMAWKYIKEYRKRSIAMVLSIALSVFLIVTIGSLAKSARVISVNDVKQNVGVNHVTYNGLSKNQIDKVKDYENVREVASSFDYGIWNSENGVSVNILSGEENILYMKDTKIIEGRYPTEPNEIAIEKWVLDRLGIPHKLNHNISLYSEEDGEKEFKLVGIIENRLHSQSYDFRDAYIAFDYVNLMSNDKTLETSVEFKEGLKFKNEAMGLGKEIEIENDKHIVLNKMLLSAMGKLEAIDLDLVQTSLILMVVGGMVIYSLYSISILKRTKEHGMIRAICSTKKQIIYVIMSEIFIVYIVGLLLGILMGVCFTYFLKGTTMTPGLFTEGNYKLDIITISSFSIKLAGFSTFGAILLAGIRGGVLANKLSPVEAMARSTQDNSINFKEKESFIEKFMTIPNKISYKNLKRNKKVIVFTIISMAIGSTFFMTKSFKKELFIRNSEKSESIGDKSRRCDILLNIYTEVPMKKGYTKEQLDEIRKLPQVENISSKQVLYSKIKIDKDMLNKLNGENYIEFMDKKGFPKFLGKFSFKGDNEDEVILRNTTLGLPSKDLEYLDRTFKIIQEEQIDVSRMENEPLAVVHIPKTKGNGVPYDRKAKGKYEPALNIKIGDKIKLTIPKEGYDENINNLELLSDHEKYSSRYLEKEFTIIGIVDEPIYKDITIAGTELAPYIYISENMFKELSGINTYRTVRINLKDNINIKDYKMVQEKVQELSEIFKETLLIDYYKSHEKTKKSAITDDLLQNIIAIILILISGLSIYNNINYNLISRIKEHGIMKAIGLTKKQFRKMIMFEGIMYGSISAIFSCIVALVVELGIFIYHSYIVPLYVWPMPRYTKRFFIDWKSFLIVIFINLAIGYIATIGPRRQVNKIEITEAIRTVE